ncbi:MAG: hypothetical protein MHMPM18_002476, partial [Marteilia pararefringens]
IYEEISSKRKTIFKSQNCEKSLNDAILAALTYVINLKQLRSTNNSNNTERIPKIYICMSNYQKVDKCIKFLKQSEDFGNFSSLKFALLFNKKPLCRNKQVKQSANINTLCSLLTRNTRSSLSCPQYKNFIKFLKSSDIDERTGSFNKKILLENLHSHEELMKSAESEDLCPYYMTKLMRKNADIIFSLHNSVLDPIASRIAQVDHSKDIFIFDSVSLLEKSACSVYSSSLYSKSLEILFSIIEKTKIIKTINFKAINRFFSYVSAKFTRSCQKILLLNIECMTGDFLLQLLATCGINYRSIQFLENALAVRYNDNKSVRRRFSDPFRLPHIQHFINVIREVLKAPQKFSVKIKPKEAINKFNLVKENYVYLNISSLTASFALNHFEKCHSLITFQQTMEPDSYSHIFDDANFSFRRCLLDKSQKKNISYKDSAFATICCLNDYSLSNFSSYNESLIKMGKSLCEIVEAVPNGIIIVFPSYRAMNLAILAWQESNVLSEFKRFKNIVDFDLSEQSAFQLEKFLNLYYRSMYWRNVLSPKSSVNGSLLMTVYGSKLLNQIDMGNNNCHTLIFAGLPTHVSDDSYESLKINYFNSLCDEREQDKAYKWLVSSKMLTINHIIERNIQTTILNSGQYQHQSSLALFQTI